jgi:hypothetical protein
MRLGTLSEEHRLRAYENMVLRKICGPRRKNEGWRKLHKN